VHQIVCRLGLRPQTSLRTAVCSPDILAGSGKGSRGRKRARKGNRKGRKWGKRRGEGTWNERGGPQSESQNRADVVDHFRATCIRSSVVTRKKQWPNISHVECSCRLPVAYVYLVLPDKQVQTVVVSLVRHQAATLCGAYSFPKVHGGYVINPIETVAIVRHISIMLPNGMSY